MIIQVNNGEEVIKLLEAALDCYTKEKQNLLLKVDSNVSKPKQLLPFPDKSSYKIGPSSLNYSYHYWFKIKNYWGEEDINKSSTLQERMELIKQVVDKYIEDYSAVYQSNIEIIQHNEGVVNKVTALMKEIGIPNSYSTKTYKSSRSKAPTYEHHQAGYLGDIKRYIPTYQAPVPNKQGMLSGVDDFYQKLLVKIRSEETKAEREKQAQEALHRVALLRAKYTPEDASSTAHDIREAILSKDKYLHLAYWLERNRGDWNDGYDYAEIGLDGFTVDPDKPVDKEIYDNIFACINSADSYIDGRIFRDTEYNYGVLYGMVEDQTLLNDLQQLKDWAGDKI